MDAGIRNILLFCLKSEQAISKNMWQLLKDYALVTVQAAPSASILPKVILRVLLQDLRLDSISKVSVS